MKPLKDKFPGTFQFFVDFFKAMNNEKGGSSLRKWLAVGFFWIVARLSFQYTDSNNLVVVLGILTGMIISLVITYSVSNIKEKGMEQAKSSEPQKTENG